MKIFLLRIGETRRKGTLAHKDAKFVAMDGKCPVCGHGDLMVRGKSQGSPSADDQAWETEAISSCCQKEVGTLRLEMSTMFGVREDHAVLNGRARVYDGSGNAP